MSGKKQRTWIDEYDPMVYPRMLWVSYSPSWEDLSKEFHVMCDDGKNWTDMPKQFFEESVEDARAVTMLVRKKSTKDRGCIVIVNKGYKTMEVVCHEAVHVCNHICETCGVQATKFGEDEPRAYLTDWIAKNIWKSLWKKR